jgi:hypothetical protein
MPNQHIHPPPLPPSPQFLILVPIFHGYLVPYMPNLNSLIWGKGHVALFFEWNVWRYVCTTMAHAFFLHFGLACLPIYFSLSLHGLVSWVASTQLLRSLLLCRAFSPSLMKHISSLLLTHTYSNESTRDIRRTNVTYMTVWLSRWLIDLVHSSIHYPAHAPLFALRDLITPPPFLLYCVEEALLIFLVYWTAACSFWFSINLT